MKKAGLTIEMSTVVALALLIALLLVLYRPMLRIVAQGIDKSTPSDKILRWRDDRAN